MDRDRLHSMESLVQNIRVRCSPPPSISAGCTLTTLVQASFPSQAHQALAAVHWPSGWLASRLVSAVLFLLAVAVFTRVTSTIRFHRQRSRQANSNEPSCDEVPVAPHWFPLVGSLIPFLRSPSDFPVSLMYVHIGYLGG